MKQGGCFGLFLCSPVTVSPALGDFYMLLGRVKDENPSAKGCIKSCVFPCQLNFSFVVFIPGTTLKNIPVHHLCWPAQQTDGLCSLHELWYDMPGHHADGKPSERVEICQLGLPRPSWDSPSVHQLDFCNSKQSDKAFAGPNHCCPTGEITWCHD